MRAALRWLARHQSQDGSWDPTGHSKLCAKAACAPNPGSDDFRIGLTGLSLLAFLGSGHTPASRETWDGIRFGDVVKKGIQFLMQQQQASGQLSSGRKYMYDHLIATCALLEAAGMTKSGMTLEPAARALQYALQAQNPGRGWRYTFRSSDNDSSVTFWGVQVLRAAKDAGFEVPGQALDGAIAWYDEATKHPSGRAGYYDANIGKVVIPGV